MSNPWETINVPVRDVNAKRVDENHVLDLFWAKDHTERYLFVCEADIELLASVKPPILKGVEIVITGLESGQSSARLIMILNDRTEWEIFYSLCMDLIQSTQCITSQSSALQIFLRRLLRWQEFLKEYKSKHLSEEKIKGLIGELLFIKDYLEPAFGISQAIQFWQGPDGLPQDFNVNNTAIEIKCQSGVSKPLIKISSADQLSTQLQELFLGVFTLGNSSEKKTGSFNLPDLVSCIRTKLRNERSSQLERFNDLLYSTGYMDLESYKNFNYLLADTFFFLVSEGFPRLVTKDLKLRIAQVKYTIHLDACMKFQKQPEWIKIHNGN